MAVTFRINTFSSVNQDDTVVKTRSNDTLRGTRNSHIGHTGGEIVPVAVAEREIAILDGCFIYTAVATHITLIGVVGIENHGVETNMQISI